LEIDTATYCKIEKGERRAKREQIVIIAKLLKTNKDELISLWLADQVIAVVANEKKLSIKALDIAKQQLQLLKNTDNQCYLWSHLDSYRKSNGLLFSKLKNHILASPTVLPTIYPLHSATFCTTAESWDKDKESFEIADIPKKYFIFAIKIILLV
jgi:hypothetical protein